MSGWVKKKSSSLTAIKVCRGQPFAAQPFAAASGCLLRCRPPIPPFSCLLLSLSLPLYLTVKRLVACQRWKPLYFRLAEGGHEAQLQASPEGPPDTAPDAHLPVLLLLPRGWAGGSDASGAPWLQRKESTKLIIRGATPGSGGGSAGKRPPTLVVEMEAPSAALADAWFHALQGSVALPLPAPLAHAAGENAGTAEDRAGEAAARKAWEEVLQSRAARLQEEAGAQGAKCWALVERMMDVCEEAREGIRQAGSQLTQVHEMYADLMSKYLACQEQCRNLEIQRGSLDARASGMCKEPKTTHTGAVKHRPQEAD